MPAKGLAWAFVCGACAAHPMTASTSADCAAPFRRSEPQRLAACVGHRITLVGVVTRSKIPTLHGVDVDVPSVDDQTVTLTGTLSRYEVAAPTQTSDDMMVATRSPGVYYALTVEPGPRDL